MLRVAASRALEEGRWSGPIGRGLATTFARVAARTIARPLRLPKGIPVVCVGGATLGGSGKTPVAIAYAKKLAREGVRVVFVGHAYRATPKKARLVHADDPVTLVGDEAILAARAGLEVVVAPSRQLAVDHAVHLGAEAIVIDGPLTLRPERPTFSILALDAARPWGSERVVPAGDLRAPREDLARLANAVVYVDASAPTELAVDLRGLRVGLVTAIARPRRLIDALERQGIVAAEFIHLPDHGGREASSRLLRRRKNSIDAWVTTEKCALHIGPLFQNERLVVLPSPQIDVGALPTMARLALP